MLYVDEVLWAPAGERGLNEIFLRNDGDRRPLPIDDATTRVSIFELDAWHHFHQVDTHGGITHPRHIKAHQACERLDDELWGTEFLQRFDSRAKIRSLCTHQDAEVLGEPGSTMKRDCVHW